MRRRSPWGGAISTGAILLLLLPSPIRAATNPVVFEPIGKWTLKYGEERCSLSREFQAGDHSLLLQIESYGARGALLFLVASEMVKVSRNASGIRYAFSPDIAERDRVEFIPTAAKDVQVLSFVGEISPVSDGHETEAPDERLVANFQSQVTSMTLRIPGGDPLELRLGSMSESMQAIQTCVDKLIAGWGMDPAQYRAQSRFPKLVSPGKGVVAAPGTRVFSGNIFVPARVMVDERGNASQCVVQLDNIGDPYKESVCGTLLGKYEPALDAAGKPTPSFYQFTSVFKLTLR